METKAEDKKTVDYNDYWLIKNNPLSKVGVFPYLGSQISEELTPDKIYYVYRPAEELSKPETLDSFKLIPITDEHAMLGKREGMIPAERKGIHGVTGENPEFVNDIITCDIKIFSEQLKNEIENGKKDLSVGYFCSYDLTPGEYNGQPYDAIQRDVKVNHIALVDEGRMGKEIRVMDSSIKPLKENKMEEKQAQDVDKRELLREVDAIAMKPASEFDGGEEEKFRTITQKLEEIAYNPSESGANDQDAEIHQGGDEEPASEPEFDEEVKKPSEDEDVDKRKLIDEIGGILKGKVDEEVWRTVIQKAEQLSYNDSESGSNDEAPAEEEKKEEKAISMDAAVKYLAKRDGIIAKIKPIIGNNVNYAKMSVSEVVKYACDKLNLKNSEDALNGYLKAKSEVRKAAPAMDAMIGKSDTIKQYLKRSK